MGKISKADQDPHQGDSDRAALDDLLSRKSKHFAVDTWILVNNEAGYVLDMPRPGILTLQWRDGSISNIKPIALNR